MSKQELLELIVAYGKACESTGYYSDNSPFQIASQNEAGRLLEQIEKILPQEIR